LTPATKQVFMKNAFLSLLIGTAVVAFFSFTNNRARLITEQYADDDESRYIADTVPHKKDTTKRRSKTVPYDSFGKPKKMDSATH
jgi:hypothetical protein